MRIFFASMIFVGAIFFSDGNEFGKSQRGTPSRNPYEVVDTLRLSAGFGAMVLNSHFTANKHNVKPTSRDCIYPSVTQIIDDTSATVRYYAVYISDNLDSLIVKSSSSADNSRIQLRILMK